ncbi:unnamed protein product [Brachionus calyciflorus]|uniref:Uncharacterized protein n=1 Tax=Brachionus calyciflorus TaxID=104777 RepID=A0A814E5E7_9BILA|nr:unnamed protein product [Brachionus calyciflorus]
MNRKKVKISLILLVFTLLNTNAQFLINTDLMIEEIDLNEQNFLPEKEIVNYRFKRNDDDDQVGSGGYEFIPKLQESINSSNNSEPNTKLNIQNQDHNVGEKSSFLIIIVSIIAGLILSIVIIVALLIVYFIKKRSSMISPISIRPSPSAPPTNSAVTYQKNETSRKINVKNTTLTQVDI